MKFSVAMKTASGVAVCIAVALLSAAGCSQGDRPTLAPVEGTILLDGQPLQGAAVCFKPEGARTSRGFTDAQGHYELLYLRDIKGAAIGHHKVSIATPSELPASKRAPAKYDQRSSTLTADVKPGENLIDFELQSH